MPYPQFDRSRLKILPLEQRVHDVDLKKVLLDPNDPAPEFSDPALPLLAEAMVKARREHDATVLMMYGAHVIRTGNALYMIELMKRGLKEENVWISDSRRMSCGIGKCGHCRINDKYVCIDGPVFRFSEHKSLID